MFALIKIPYENKDFEMKIILPKTSGRYLELKVLETYLNLSLTMDQTREKNIFRVETIKAIFSVSVRKLVLSASNEGRPDDAEVHREDKNGSEGTFLLTGSRADLQWESRAEQDDR